MCDTGYTVKEFVTDAWLEGTWLMNALLAEAGELRAA
jgi:hypothetical protein